MPTGTNVRKVVINPQGLALANKRSFFTLGFFLSSSLSGLICHRWTVKKSSY